MRAQAVFVVRNENKRLRSRHLFSPERTRNKNISREATTAAKQTVFMSAKRKGTKRRQSNSNEGGTAMVSLQQELASNSYPGRGIVIGKSGDGKYAVTAYFIMGRSSNSRNRVFVTEGEGIRTQAFDPSKLEDPSLIIYAPVRVLGYDTIVTNGDQTDTIYDGMASGETFEQSLRCREFEPDGPNYTPRISGLMHIEGGKYDYAMSILKSNDGDPDCCNRYTFTYDNPKAGEGRFIHTYIGDGNPLPSFAGEPTKVDISGDIDAFTEMVWNALNEDNKVSLFVRFIDIATGKYETRIVNKNK
jgi:IMP cyclohydrolase